MDIQVNRKFSSDVCVVGNFSTAEKTWFSLELPLAFEGKEDVPDKTCVPAGTYEVKNLWSGKHNCLMPHVIIPHVDGIPDRTQIEIHPASCPDNLLGCTAIGENWYNQNPTSPADVVINGSQAAFEEFRTMFDNALASEEKVTISYLNEF